MCLFLPKSKPKKTKKKLMFVVKVVNTIVGCIHNPLIGWY